MEDIYAMIARQLAIRNRVAILKELKNIQWLEPDDYITELKDTIDIVDEDLGIE